MELICAQGNWPVLYMGRSATYIALVCHDACSAGRLVQRKQRMMTLKRLSPARLTPLPNVTVQRSIVAQHTSCKRGFIAGATPTARTHETDDIGRAHTAKAEQGRAHASEIPSLRHSARPRGSIALIRRCCIHSLPAFEHRKSENTSERKI